MIFAVCPEGDESSSLWFRVKCTWQKFWDTMCCINIFYRLCYVKFGVIFLELGVYVGFVCVCVHVWVWDCMKERCMCTSEDSLWTRSSTFTWIPGIDLLVMKFTWQVFYLPNHLLGPKTNFLFTFRINESLTRSSNMVSLHRSQFLHDSHTLEKN